MLVVENGNVGPQLVSNWVLGEIAQPTTDGVAAGVARSRVQPQEGCVCKENECANAHVAPLIIRISKCQNRVDCQNDIEN